MSFKFNSTSKFLKVCPEFNGVDQNAIMWWLESTGLSLNETSFGPNYEMAAIYLTAHRMKLAGLGEESAFGKLSDRAGVSSYTEGSTSVSFESGSGAGTPDDVSLSQTIYGQEYLRLRSTIIPILVRR